MKIRAMVVALAVLLAAGFAADAAAQVATGNIAGGVKDEQGGALPGALVTLKGVDATQTNTTDAAGEFRFLNLAPGPYSVTVTLPGFKTYVREGLIVAVGRNVDVPVILGVASVAETVTVSGSSPVVDTKQMGTATNFTQEELSRVPNSRDPWALLRTVPGVTLDRVNIAGNETGQQATFVGKGGRTRDAVWTMDGIPITDMATTGASPTYFDYDAFEEIQISTAGNDIRQPTGAVGLNFVVKRGTNQYRGTARGYFTNNNLEANNLPSELQSRGKTYDTSDHNQKISEAGVDVGGPVIKDRLFFWGSYANQDIKLYRQSANGIDETVLKTYNAKGTWQISQKDTFNFLLFNGDKVKHGRAPGYASFEPSSARWEQHNYYSDNPFHGLWKLEDNHTFGSNLFLTGKYAYYNTGFTLESQDISQLLGISSIQGATFGAADSNFFRRPQHTINIDANTFNVMGNATHNFKFGFGWRRTDAFSQDIYPGNMIVAYENSATDFRARMYREGAGTNRSFYVNVYVGDTLTIDRLTLDLGARYDRQYGRALPSITKSNAAFANLVPGINFTGYDAPFHWNNLTPRIGMTYAVDEQRKTVVKASWAMTAGQLSDINNNIGYANPSSSAGWVEYPWIDQNRDHLAQASEVQVNLPLLASGNGFNTANPTAVTSANQIDPNVKAPITNAVVVGIERELMPNFGLQVNYTYNRTTDHSYTPFINVVPSDYTLTTPLTGNLPAGAGGAAYNIPLYIPDAAKVAAVGGGRAFTNWPGYYTTFNGIEFAANKRMSNKWQMRLAASWNNAEEFYDVAVDELGNPTRIDTSPVINGGQLAPRSSGSGSGDVFVNQKWNFNINGAYQLPWGLEAAGNLFGKQGTPYPYYRNAALGRDGSRRVLITPDLDTVRFNNLWDLDLRLSKSVRFADRGNLQLIADLFNVMNSNTEINRERNAAATTFGFLTQNLSPRILRLGVRLGF